MIAVNDLYIAGPLTSQADLMKSSVHRTDWTSLLPGASLFRKVANTLVLLSLVAISSCALAQGCTQCRDNAAATLPATQAAYRHAIILLVATAGAVFTGTVLLLKRSR